MEELRAAEMVSWSLIHPGKRLPKIQESPGLQSCSSSYWDSVQIFLFFSKYELKPREMLEDFVVILHNIVKE